MDNKDLKHFLYAWLGKQKLGQPTYTYTNYKRGNANRFKCEVRVPGFSFFGIGDSLNKKDASTNSAMDFCNFLVREGKLDATELPILTADSLTTTNGCLDDNEEEKKTEWVEYRHTEDNPNSGIPKSNFDKYVNQKAAEITQSENVDLKAEIHGGWTVENSKGALNEFFQRVRLPIPNYETHRKEAIAACSTFESRLTVFIPQLNKSLSGFGDGSTKKVAESYCSMSVVRQLYHLGVMAEYKGVRRKTTSSTLPAIPVNIDPSLANRVHEFVIKAGVIPVSIIDVASVTSDSPVSLMVNCKLAEFPDSEVTFANNVNWAPSLPNWDPWKGTNIDEAPLALMNMDQISAELLNREVPLEESISKRLELPVAEFRQQILETIKNNPVTLIKGETGCGKSTQVVQYLLESDVRNGRGAQFNAIVSQPRRISAITLAERVACERNEKIGNSVGYAVRFDCVLPRPYGSVLFCTVGVLLRRMEGGLRGISHIIIDEIHERDVNTDFVLIVLREMVKENPDIRVILMSATIDTELFTNYFGNCPVIEMQGRMHSVQQFFLEDVLKMVNFDAGEIKNVDNDLDEDGNDEKSKNLNLAPIDGYPASVVSAMRNISESDIPYDVIQALLLDINANGEEGAVLIFLPGWSEIMLILNMLNSHSVFGDQSRFVVLPLHSQLSSLEQRKVFHHYENTRKIILTTNIAETSVTIDDVVYVIDSCRAKERTYTSNNNMVHFATVWASRTNLAQRRGRAGRVRPGFAYHLCSKARFEALEEYRVPEMLRTPLHEVSLTIKLLRLGSVGDFLAKALQPPPVDMIIESEALLQSMGALDNNLELTPLGNILAHLPIEPVMGKTIVLATALGIGSLMCQLASGSSFSSPFIQKLRIHTRLSGLQNLAPIDGYPASVVSAMRNISESDIPYDVIQALLLDINANGEEGAVLIFLPGWSEIMLILNMLNSHSVFGDQSRFVVLPLHSQLSSLEQRKVFHHYENTRKIILTTNIAETSVTIDDVVYVIDSCRAKERTYTSNNNMVHFATVWASRTNLAQRRGRAGRVRPGFAYHLCSKARFEALEEYRVPEMLRTPLHEVSLTIKLLRLGSVGDFLAKALQPPPVDMIIESEALLQSMGALDNNLELTPLGNILAHLPIEPVMGKTIVLATALGIGSLMCQLASGSSFSSPFIQKLRIHTRLSGLQRSLAGNRWSDHIATVNASQHFELAAEQNSEINFCDRYSLSLPILKMISGARKQLVDVLTNQCGFPPDVLQDISISPESNSDANLDLMTTLLINAFYPNIAFYRGKRKVYTLEHASALVNKLSILTPFKGDNISVPSPLMVFTEKVRSRCIACKELTVISVIQLLLFGCRKIDCIGENLVKLDDMITVSMPVAVASDIVALRPYIESLVIRTCMSPSTLVTPCANDIELKNLLVELSSTAHFSTHEPESNYLLTKTAANHFEPVNSSNRGRGRGSSQTNFNGFRGVRNRYQVSDWSAGYGYNPRNFEHNSGNAYNFNNGGGPVNTDRGSFRPAPYHLPNGNRGGNRRGRGQW